MRKILQGLAFALASFGAQAATINFEDLPFGSCAFYGPGTTVSGGFNFDGNPVDSNLFGCPAGLIGGNTSNALINANDNSIVTMSQVGGGSFSLNSFDAGNRFDFPGTYGVSSGVDVLGFVTGGGTVNAQFFFSSNTSFDTFVLGAGFSSLDSVVFSAITSVNGQFVGSEFLIDDIVVNQGNRVPEPASLLLVSTALFGIAAARRRKSAKA